MTSNPETWCHKKWKPRGFGFLWRHNASGFDIIWATTIFCRVIASSSKRSMTMSGHWVKSYWVGLGTEWSKSTWSKWKFFGIAHCWSTSCVDRVIACLAQMTFEHAVQENWYQKRDCWNFKCCHWALEIVCLATYEAGLLVVLNILQ